METKINDELLTRFLANDLPVADRERVKQWIEEKEEHRQYFLALQQAWQLAGMKDILDHALDEINVEDKWHAFKQAVASPATEPPVNSQGGKLAIPIDGESSRRSAGWLKAAIAASVILVLGLGWLFLGKDPQRGKETVVTQGKDRRWLARRESNLTGRERTIYLPDSSVVVLADKSEISYEVYETGKQVDSFGDRRYITLTGKAAFKVAHDRSRPFTVISKDITTTALGTEFTVTAWAAGSKISVRLYEGKVVIRAIGKAASTMKKEVYLVAGQEFVYDGTGRVSWFQAKKRPAATNNIKKEEDPLIPDDAGQTWYMFNNQPLDQVLKQLSALYNMPIVYNRRDVRNSYFTAKYKSTDSLETILERIARLNKLTITKNDTAFILTK